MSKNSIPEDALLIDNEVKVTDVEDGIEVEITFITEEEIPVSIVQTSSLIGGCFFCRGF